MIDLIVEYTAAAELAEKLLIPVHTRDDAVCIILVKGNCLGC